MNITSAQYEARQEIDENNQLTVAQNIAIRATIDGTKWSVPLDPANRHYAEIMRQVEAGELVIQEADQ